MGLLGRIWVGGLGIIIEIRGFIYFIKKNKIVDVCFLDNRIMLFEFLCLGDKFSF